MPWRGHPVRLRITVRRFRCGNLTCRRSTFAEDCGENLPRYARRTREVSLHLLQIVQVAGGEAGARLASDGCIAVSPDTLLRLQRDTFSSRVLTPRVLGVDDLALRRGQTYVTIFVDLETHKPIDLVEGRAAKTLEDWLKAHPGVEVISRDRAPEYAEGAKAGAPQAIQVADRFHLIQNASNALDSMMRGRTLSVEAPNSPEEPLGTEPNEAGASVGVEAVDTETPDPGQDAVAAPDKPLSPTKQYLADRKAAKATRWEKVRAMAQAKVSVSQIARDIGISRKTVRRLIRTPELPRNRVGTRRPGGLESPILRPYVSYLQERWQAGCTNVAQLHREIVERGYPGSMSRLRQVLYAWRPPRPPKKTRQKAGRQTRRSTLRWLCLRPPGQLKPEELPVLEKLLARNNDLARGYELLQSFREVVASRSVSKLDAWLNNAKRSNLPTFAALANGFEADRVAVDNSLTFPWSNGPVEGVITKVKLIKRQGYGRAKFDLLRIRVLSA